MSDSRNLPLLSGPLPSVNDSGHAESACRKCNKEFNVIFTRAKRCSHCGYSYCSSCADYQALMPRQGAESGYDAVTVCAYCIELLTITAAGKAQLKSLPLSRLKKYVEAYNIKADRAIEKQDLVDCIVAARDSNGCLPVAHEDYYRRHSVPSRQTRPRGFWARMGADTRAAGDTSSTSQTPRQSRPYNPSPQPFARPDLDNGNGPSPSWGQQRQQPPQFHVHAQPPPPNYGPYPQYSRPQNRTASGNFPRAQSAYPRPTSAYPPNSHGNRSQQPPRQRTTSVPPAPRPSPPPSLDQLITMSQDQVSNLSIHALKNILWDNHVNARLILEKSDLVAKVNALLADERRERERKRREEEEEAERIRILMEQAAAEAEEQRRQAEAVEIAADATPAPEGDPSEDMSTTRPAAEEAKTHSAPRPAPFSLTPSVEKSGLCVICQDEEANIAIVDCGHLAMCRSCSELIMSTSRECPLCRTRIVTEARLLRIFKT